MQPSARFLLPLLLVATASGLDVVIRADAVSVIEVDGPAKLRERFLATNLGTMLATKKAAAFWAAVRRPLRNALASLGVAAGAPPWSALL